MEKVIVEPLIQRVEQHITKKEIAPTTQTKVEDVEKIEVQPYIMKEEQHITKKEIAPVMKSETKNITKKVIQPIIKDVIQPVHIKVKPILQESIKPTIYKGEQIRQPIDQGTQNLPASFQGTKVEKEVLTTTAVRESIVKSSVLPTEHKPTEVKPEIGGGPGGGGFGGGFGGGSGGGFGAGMESNGVRIESNTLLTSGINKEIIGSTTVRPSIIKNSVLPTIDGGTKVLKTVYGGTTVSRVEGGGNNQLELGGAGTGTITTTTTTTTQYGGSAVVRKLDAQSSSSSIGYGTSAGNINMRYGENIMGVGGGVGDEAADVTYSTKPDNSASALGSMTTSKVVNPFN